MIYLIITTSIYNKIGVKNDIHRKETYINSINKTLSFLPNEIKPIIVENNGKRKTYLDTLNCDIIYTNNNKINSIHKGINELLDIKEVINIYDIKDEDIIIKLTGRYHLTSSYFFDLVINTTKDAFVSFFNVCELKYMEYDCVLGLFAIKCKYLKVFEYDCKNSPEVEFATFVKKNISSIMEVKKLFLRCCFADDLRIVDV
jgi:hypothetical protein